MKSLRPNLDWLCSLIVAIAILWVMGAVGSVAWYLLVPMLTAVAFIELFSSVWLGITLLSLLFVYCSVGSAGVPVSIFIWEPQAWRSVREIPVLEMTEFEWFHWWPFVWLVALVCWNMVLVTTRRIPLTVTRLGAWIVHTGIIVLALGSLKYFGAKVEGDVAIARARVVVEVPGHDPVSMVAAPGKSVTVGDTAVIVGDIEPHDGYRMTVAVQSGGDEYVRELTLGGETPAEDPVRVAIESDPHERFFLTQSAAIHIRELGADGRPLTPWIERPIRGLPRFNDYPPSLDDVWAAHGMEPSPLSVSVPAHTDDDPVAGDMTISGYLRYAIPETRYVAGGDQLFPAMWATLRRGGTTQPLELFAFSPSAGNADPSLMAFRWVESDAQRSAVHASALPTLHVKTTEPPLETDIPVAGAVEFLPIGETGYDIRVQAMEDNLNIGGSVVSLLRVEIRHDGETWLRWVFDNPAMNRDLADGVEHTEHSLLDDNIVMSYRPGSAPITIVAGPTTDNTTLVTSLGTAEPLVRPLIVGTPIPLAENVTLTLDRVERSVAADTRPIIVPPHQRDPNAANMFSMVHVQVPGATMPVWLMYHHYPFESQADTLRRFRFTPTTIEIGGGRSLEMLYSRSAAPLPAPIVLDDFEVDSHVGGFTGSTASIRNWRSIVSIGGGESVAVSVNDPQPHEGYWFYQSQWDPPDGMSQGLNYTVLGVGNREGVWVQLAGSVLMVLGMLYAFYVKPVVIRRRADAAVAAAEGAA
ncbi:MAG: hypothetical protein QGH76_00590 [Phycisphaerales bacterium]|jgi:hypothetical protein|nr:hypothetical protein [Phycisphaerales bacterium]